MDLTMWKSSNGDYTKIKDMTSVHIRHCIKLIERQNPEIGEPEYSDLKYSEFKPYIEVFKKELAGREITTTKLYFKENTHE